MRCQLGVQRPCPAPGNRAILPLLATSVPFSYQAPTCFLLFQFLLPERHIQLFMFTQDPPPGGDIGHITGLAPLAPWRPRTPWAEVPVQPVVQRPE